MKITIPAMRGKQGGRDFFNCTIAMSEVPRMFTAETIPDLTPEEREQRAVTKARLNQIAKYMVENADGYILPPITAAYKGENVEFVACDLSPNLGVLEMDLSEVKFLIHDGQHREGGIEAAIRLNEELGHDSIGVFLLPYEDRSRSQQIFSDINRTMVKTSRTLDILYNRRDQLNRVVLQTIENVPVFTNMVDKEHTSLTKKSMSLVSLQALYEGSREFFLSQPSGEAPALYQEQVDLLTEFWNTVAKNIPDWERVRKGELTSETLRTQSISTHATLMRAIGAVGGQLVAVDPKHWKSRLAALRSINWAKDNKADWENTVIISNSVSSGRQARMAAKVFLRKKLGIAETALTQHADVVAEVEMEPKTKGPKRVTTPGKRSNVSTKSSTPRKAMAA